MTAEPPSRALDSRLGRGTRESVLEWYGELQRIGMRLQQVHDQALADGDLRGRRERLLRQVQQAMETTDPALPSLALRAEQIPGEMSQARQRGDVSRMGSLDRELAQILARFMNVQQQVQRQPGIARQIQEYEELLRRAMIRIEPLTDRLLARSTELQELLQQYLGPVVQ